MPTAPSIRRAARSKRCAAARRAWRSRCSSSRGRARWARVPASPAGLGQPRAQQQTDPLGRPLRGRDYGDDVTVKVPGEIDVQRARRILEELRRRFGESFRPQLELDYIERLLKAAPPPPPAAAQEASAASSFAMLASGPQSPPAS